MRSSTRMFLATLTLSTVSPALAGANPLYIVGGGPEAGHPAVGALVAGDGALCTGTLVSPDTVLTAAHCLAGASTDTVQFFMGPDASGPGELAEVASLHQHPDFSWDADSDTPPRVAAPARGTPAGRRSW